MTRLVPTHDDDFLWLLGATGPSRGDLTLVPGEIAEPHVLQALRALATNLRAYHDRGSWMIVAANGPGSDEVVGLCSYKAAPDFNGVVEIGYSVAESRRRLGHATRAVAAVLAEAIVDPMVKTVIASAAQGNLGSRRVLEKNGFTAFDRRAQIPEGELILWRRGVDRTR